MSDISAEEIERWALDASDWLWGTVQGTWNEKQTTSQIIVDAVIGMIPLVGDVTAVRDLLAVATHLAENPKRREDVSEWVLLVVLLLALIPVLGGVLKGVGRLLLKLGKSAADNHILIREIIEFLNRLGHGDAVKFIQNLSFAKYTDELSKKFNEFCEKILETLRAIRSRFGFLSSEMKTKIDQWIEWFSELKMLAGKMIPKAIKDLDERLRIIQRAIYEGNWHVVSSSSTSAKTREAEARLLENPPPPRPKGEGYPKNRYEDYVYKKDWPDLKKDSETDKFGEVHYKNIEAFSGEIKAITIKGPKQIFRIIKPGANYPAGKWWTEVKPKSGKEWREKWAVLDEFNENGHYIVYDIPAGMEIKAWRGVVSEQFGEKAAQWLPGGETQLYIDTSAIHDELMALTPKSTNWGETMGQWGFDKEATKIHKAHTERLRKKEFELKTKQANVD